MYTMVTTGTPEDSEFEPATRGTYPRLGATILQELIESITSGSLPPGAMLPPEATLGHSYGVSRSVIRETIKRLEEKGLVEVNHGRGTTITPTAAWNVLDPMILASLIAHDHSLRTLDDIVLIRSSLEGTMAALTATGRTDEHLAGLVDALDGMREALHDEAAFIRADHGFHLIVMSASGSVLGDAITRTLVARARANRLFTLLAPPEDLVTSLDEHRRVFDAIVRKDALAAETAMRDHIREAWARRRPSRSDPHEV